MRTEDRLLSASAHPFALTDQRRDNQALHLEKYQQGAVQATQSAAGSVRRTHRELQPEMPLQGKV